MARAFIQGMKSVMGMTSQLQNTGITLGSMYRGATGFVSGIMRGDPVGAFHKAVMRGGGTRGERAIEALSAFRRDPKGLFGDYPTTPAGMRWAGGQLYGGLRYGGRQFPAQKLSDVWEIRARGAMRQPGMRGQAIGVGIGYFGAAYAGYRMLGPDTGAENIGVVGGFAAAGGFGGKGFHGMGGAVLGKMAMGAIF